MSRRNRNATRSSSRPRRSTSSCSSARGTCSRTPCPIARSPRCTCARCASSWHGSRSGSTPPRTRRGEQRRATKRTRAGAALRPGQARPTRAGAAMPDATIRIRASAALCPLPSAAPSASAMRPLHVRRCEGPALPRDRAARAAPRTSLRPRRPRDHREPEPPLPRAQRPRRGARLRPRLHGTEERRAAAGRLTRSPDHYNVQYAHTIARVPYVSAMGRTSAMALSPARRFPSPRTRSRGS